MRKLTVYCYFRNKKVHNLLKSVMKMTWWGDRLNDSSLEQFQIFIMCKNMASNSALILCCGLGEKRGGETDLFWKLHCSANLADRVLPPEWMTFSYCFLWYSHCTWEDFNVNSVFHFSLRDEQWNCMVLEDLLENIEMDAFLALYSQVSMKLNKASRFILQLYQQISFSSFLGTVADIFGPSSANSHYQFWCLQHILPLTSINSDLLFSLFNFTKLYYFFTYKSFPAVVLLHFILWRELNCLSLWQTDLKTN